MNLLPMVIGTWFGCLFLFIIACCQRYRINKLERDVKRLTRSILCLGGPIMWNDDHEPT